MPHRKIHIVTHSGPFHPDDVLSVAVLDTVLAEEYMLTRTRDQETIESGDYVVDVGGVYDEGKNRFDHHQKGGAGKRSNGIPYSSIGLVWKKFGKALCGSKEVSENIEKRLVVSVDAFDNGVDITKSTMDDETAPYGFHDVIMAFRPAWNEDQKKRSFDDGFREAVSFAKVLLEREIVRTKAKMEAERLVKEAYEKAEDKRIIVLDEYYPSGGVLREFPEPLFIVYPDHRSSRFSVKSINESSHTFTSRKLFPEAWAGKTGKDLEEASGVEGAHFCHNGLFIAIAETKEGAMELARIAVNS